MRDRTTTLIDTFAAIAAPEEFALSPDGSAVAFRHDVNGYSQIFTLSIERGYLGIIFSIAQCRANVSLISNLLVATLYLV